MKILNNYLYSQLRNFFRFYHIAAKINLKKGICLLSKQYESTVYVYIYISYLEI